MKGISWQTDTKVEQRIEFLSNFFYELRLFNIFLQKFLLRVEAFYYLLHQDLSKTFVELRGKQ